MARSTLLLLAAAAALISCSGIHAFLLPSPPPSSSGAGASSSCRAQHRRTLLSAVDEASTQAAAAAAAGSAGPQPGQAQRRLFSTGPKPSGPWILLEGLPYAAREGDLREFLQGFEVQSVQMPMAPENTKRAGETKGIGIVELGSEAEAARAVEALNGKEVLGRWVTVEPCLSPREAKTIKIRGVPFAATPEDLSSYFGGLFGEVEHVVISHDRNGIAYLTFKDNASAVAALAQDGCQMNNRWLDITLYLKGAFRPQDRPPLPRREGAGGPNAAGGGGGGGNGGGGSRGLFSRKNRLRLTGIPFEATVAEVTAALEGLGLPVSNVFMPPFKGNPERNIGIAYLNIVDDAAYGRALETASFVLGERTVYINEAQDRLTTSGPGSQQQSPQRRRDDGDEGDESSSPRQGGGGGGPVVRDQPWENRVYLGNLPFDLTQEDIASFFEAKGVAGLSKIALPKTKVGTAYVAFETPEMAEKAAALDGTLIEKDGRTRYLRANLMDAR